MEQTDRETLQKIKLPKNVRQIGTIDRYSRIYIEDYVVTYLKQMATAQQMSFGVAALFGRTVYNGREKYVFISGAVYRTEESEEELSLLLNGGPTREMQYEFREQKERYFSELDHVGVALIYDERANVSPLWDNRTQLMSLLGRGAVQIRICQADSIEEYSFYNEEGVETKDGHYVYFEQNEAMQSFLVEWHASEETGIAAEQEDYPAKTCRMVLNEKKEEREHDKSSSRVSWASIFLLVAICAVGVVMINRYEKAKEQEETVTDLAQIPVTEVVVSVDTIEMSENEAGVYATESVVSEYALATNETVSTNETISTNETVSTNVADYIFPSTEPISVVETAQLTEPMLIPQEYTIEKGDTLCSISRRFYGSENHVPAICELNQIQDQNNIFYGQVIFLPQE